MIEWRSVRPTWAHGRTAAAALGLCIALGLGSTTAASAPAREPSAAQPDAPTSSADSPRGTEAADGQPTSPGEVPSADDVQPTPNPAPPDTLKEADVEGPTVDDGILPCGLRVIIAQDATLPVASVVLALETGTEDDPAAQPGLVHALAYQLLQGNRELRPGGAAALVHDRGGVTTLAIGPAQVRYESLVPMSALTDVLWAESQRLRAPTVSAELWSSTLRWARRDRPRNVRIPRAAMAAAHGVPGLEHEGRAVGPTLQSMVPRAIGQALAERMRYDIATLVVVSPHPPQELREQIEGLFADLPARPRELRDRQPRWRTGSAPQESALAGEKGQRFVWPVAPDHASVALAIVWCKAINRQKRAPGEPSRARLRCHMDEDHRRATIILTASGVESPIELVQTRLGRLEQGEDDPLIDRQRQVVSRQWRQDLRGPLPLARRLATGAPRPSTAPGWMTRPTDWLTGVATLAIPWAQASGFGPHSTLGAAIHLVPTEGGK